MNFKVTLQSHQCGFQIPINYQYPLSSAIYRILSKGDGQYAEQLHSEGYGKGFKFFCFSNIICPFNRDGDRLVSEKQDLHFYVSFHLSKAVESFVKGLFHSENMTIADEKSKATFQIKSIESMPDTLKPYKEQEIVQLHLKPISPLSVGLQNEKDNYDFLSPEDPRFVESLVYNWRSKIETVFDKATAESSVLLIEILWMKNPPKSKLLTIKADTKAETKIRGWMNFGLKVTGEKRFVELLLNSGMGIYNAQGMGYVMVQ